MKPLALAGSVLLLGACAPARTASRPTVPAPVRAEPAIPAAPPSPTPAPSAPAPREAARDWQLLDPAVDSVPGIAAERAMRELLAGKSAKRTVIVAVIDGGVDTAHVDLKANLWSNPKEITGNGKDDDNNGYVDDVRGWNFIGGRDGRDVQYDTHEVTRLQARCTGAPAAGSPRPTLTPEEQGRCPAIAAEFAKRRGEAEQTLQQVRAIGAALSRVVPILKRATGADSLTPARVASVQSPSPEVQQAKQIYLQLAANGITAAEVEEARIAYESQTEYGLNTAFDPRAIVGDNYADPAERRYGNSDVMGPDAKHGTHVAGIIGATRGNGIGVDGIAPAVRIMAVRAVPDGDERDKDVANAIRYAVDNGAQVINMSFGKGYSPYKSAVDAAVKYAEARGVLLIHAAGNDGADLGKEPNFPTRRYDGGGDAKNWIEVGASSWQGGDSLAATFSNYNATQVDVFAPGVDILSTVPNGGYERESGTSMAAPVVTGLAALLMAYYPNLTAADVKRIILASATRYPDQLVAQPGAAAGERVQFRTLSATGGVVNAYAAIRMAEGTASSAPTP